MRASMDMEFRARNYKAEREVHAVPRIRADSHPLCTAPTSDRQVDVVDDQVEIIFDPLREQGANVAASVDSVQDAISPSPKVSTKANTKENLTREWTSFKRFLMQRFPVSKTVPISLISDQILRSGKGNDKLSTTVHSDVLEDPQKVSEDGLKFISRQEYIARLKEFKEKIAQAWHSDDRVTALKLAIKVAKLLTDTSVSQFYSTLFVLVTDIMDMLGDMVWERIMKKAESAEEGSGFCSLSGNFIANDVCLDAKETCKNWFWKIASVRELLPRIYLEVALLPCWHFLLDQPVDCLHRLIAMTRGLADPLPSSYCLLYIAYSAQKLPSSDTGYLIRSIKDIKFKLIHAIPPKDVGPEVSNDGRSSCFSLIEPPIEYIMHGIFVNTSQRQVSDALVELGLGNEDIHGNIPPVSLILHHLIKGLPADTVNCKAMDIINLIGCCNDCTLDQCSNYRLLGFRLSESEPSEPVVNAVDQVIQVVSEWEKLDEYLKVVDAFVDLILLHHVDNYLVIILEGISKRACDKGIVEDDLVCLQSIMVKILLHFKDLEDVFALNHFLEILDIMYGRPQAVVSMRILEKAIRGGFKCDPTTIQLLFKVSQALHDSIDQAYAKEDDYQQPARLMSQFVSMVDYGSQMERHLTFLVECRGAFGSTNELKETLIHSSNFLAMKALKDAVVNINFIKSCIAFSEVTIPSVTSLAKQLNLYLDIIEVALHGGLLSHADGLVDSVISCLQNSDLMDGSQGTAGIDDIMSSLQKFCSLLVIIPGNPGKVTGNTSNILSALLDLQSWMTPRVRSRVFCALIILSATLSQNCLPLQASNSGIPSNDALFYGDVTYMRDLVSFSELVLKKLVDTIKQEPSHVVRGGMALEACNCIELSFRMTQEISEVCLELLEMAKEGLDANDKYLKSTINLLNRYSSTCQINS